MCAKYYENPTMLSKVTAKNVGDVFFETHCRSKMGALLTGGSSSTKFLHRRGRPHQSFLHG